MDDATPMQSTPTTGNGWLPATATTAISRLRDLCKPESDGGGAAYMRLADDEPTNDRGEPDLPPVLAVAVTDVLAILDQSVVHLVTDETATRFGKSSAMLPALLDVLSRAGRINHYALPRPVWPARQYPTLAALDAAARDTPPTEEDPMVHGKAQRGRWWFYFDTAYMSIGRHAGENSVIYSLFGLVAEHYRPEGYAANTAADGYTKAIRKWQKVRNTVWHRTAWTIEQKPGESYPEWTARRWHFTCVRYAALADDARAYGELVPSIEELRVEAPFGIPTAVHDADQGR